MAGEIKILAGAGGIMPITVTKEEYHSALDAALDLLNTPDANWSKPFGEQALGSVVAWAWDGGRQEPDALDGLMGCDRRILDLALTIIAGRCYHMRPAAHQRSNEIEGFCYQHGGKGTKRSRTK